MSANNSARSSQTRSKRVSAQAFRSNLRALRPGRSVRPSRAKLHAPLVLSSEPRTDVAPADLAAKPWLRFYPANVPLTLSTSEQTLPLMLGETARQFPDNPALIYFGQKMLYQELDTAADRFAAGLHAGGLQPGDRVALLMPNCPQFVIAFYGALRAGAIVVPCNPLYVERELEQQLKNSGASVLVTLTVFSKLVEAVRQRVELRQVIVGNVKDYFPSALRLVFTATKEKKDGHRATIGGPNVHNWLEFLEAAKDKTLPALEIRPDDTAVYQYTGGTTGQPKGAMLSHRNLVTNARMAWAWLGEGEKGHDVTLAAIPFFHVYGLSAAMNLSIYSGGALVLLPRFAPLEVLKAIQRYRPTLFPGVPAMYIALLNHPKVAAFDLRSVEACISGAAPLPLQVATRFEELTGAKVIEGFGMTEASPITHGNPLYGQRKEGSIGLPFPGVEARIVDLDSGLNEMPPGEIGEMIVRGPMVMGGYYARPDETANTIRDGWLYTGDIARMDAEGYFYIVDRKKDMILSNGFNVYPREVEEVLYQHPAVREAVVIGAPNERGDDTVKAFVVLKEGQTASAEEIIAFCRESLSRYKAPRAVEFRAELPKTLIGKHLRRVLVEEERQKVAALQTASETAIVEAALNAAQQPAVKGNQNLPQAMLHNVGEFAGKVRHLPGKVHLPPVHLPKVKLPFNHN